MAIFNVGKVKTSRTCNECGKEVSDDMAFCPYCGTKIELPEIEDEFSEESAFQSTMFMHPSDKAALKALKTIPGFTPLMKSFMNIWNERMFRIENLSSNIRLSEQQMPKYYNMLPPICEKLGIEVPELYLALDVVPNAWTYGDTKPFITMTSGLIETVPDELIPTVLAHECGHIACHHTLYTTIGRIVFNAAISASSNFVPFIGRTVSFPLQVAFYYWMRCSELSADRAAVFYNNGSSEVIEMCMRFAGYDKDVHAEGNIDLFLKQADEYREMVKNSKWDKTLEFLMFNNRTHPLSAVRAAECRDWASSEDFFKLISRF